MCGLCSDDPETKAAAKREALNTVDQLTSLAQLYKDQVYGKVPLHSGTRLASQRALAYSVIRLLVADWV